AVDLERLLGAIAACGGGVHRPRDLNTPPANRYAVATPPQASRTTKVVRASQIAAVIEIAANRSPIGKATIFFTHTIAGRLLVHRQAATVRPAPGAGAAPGPSPDCSIGGWGAVAAAC